MIKVTMKHAAIGNVQMEFGSFAELFEKATLLSQMPEKCDKCGSDVVLLFKNVTASQGARKGTKMKYYGLQCIGAVRHEYYLGIHNDESRELFAYGGRTFQDPYTNDQLATAEYREACEYCKSTNQYHAADCPNADKTKQEAHTEEKPAKVDNSTAKPTEATAVTTGQAASAVKTEPTPLQVSRNRFIKAVGDLGLSMGNTELATMLKSMLGVESVPSPLTPEHWITCYNLCNEYKTAAEIGGIALDANALAVMLCASGETPGTRKIEQYNAAEWKAAAERAMEG